jgi:hypothetical protein
MRAIVGIVLVCGCFTLLLPARLAAAQQAQIVYGGDVTQAQRAELARLLGVDPSAHAGSVTMDEVRSALQGTGVPVSASERAITGSAVTCTGSGSGLRVRTQNITRVSPFVYAGMLVTAGAADSNVAVAAPSGQPATGETALVGTLQSYPACSQGALDPARISLAYKQLAWAMALAGPKGDLNAATSLLLRAETPIVAGEAQDGTAIASGLDSASRAAAISVPDYLRPALLEFLGGFRGLNFGQWASGFSLEPGPGNEVRAVPATAALAGGNPLIGTVAQPMPLLMVRSGSRTVAINVPATSILTRNGSSVGPDALRKGDRVTLTLNPDGSAQRVVATGPSGQGTSWVPWVVVVLLLLAALAALEFSRPRHDDTFVLEPKRPDGRRST